MVTRKATEGGEERPKKKARTGGASGNDVTASPEDTVTFSSLPNDCKVHAFSFLPSEDMNSAACCNKDCQQVRANESLDQKRTGTLVWTARTTIHSFCNKVREIRNRFTGNMTRLKVVGLETYGREDSDLMSFVFGMEEHLDGARFEQVTSLDCSRHSPDGLEEQLNPFVALSRVLPNLRELDLSNHLGAPVQAFSYRCPRLTKITCNHGCALDQCGNYLAQCTSLTHLYLDGVCFSAYVWVVSEPGGILVQEQVFASSRSDYYLFMKCQRLESLSLKGAAVRRPYGEESDLERDEENDPLSQEALIKMVRRHPTLRWLRSDLTPDNVAMLKRERPEIAFVSD